MTAMLRNHLSANRHPRTLSLVLLIPWLGFMALAGYFVFTELYRARLQGIEEQQVERVTTTLSTLDRELGHIRHLTRVLKDGVGTAEALQAGQPADTERLLEHFQRFARASGTVSQLRWLDLQGQERARVNVHEGRTEAVRPEDLQNKADRYYFRQALQTPAGEVYVSPLDLNVERGRIVEPFEPTLRAAMRTGGEDGLLPGLLIVNFNLAQQFAQLRQPDGDTEGVELLDQDGYWMLGPDPAREWGRLQGRADDSLAKASPSLWVGIARGGRTGHLMHDGRLWQYARLYYDDGAGGDNWLYVLSGSAAGQIAALRNQLLLPVLAGCLLVTLAGLVAVRRLIRAEQERAALTLALEEEQRSLQHAYGELKTSHDRLGLLQDELVESRKLSSLGMMVAGIAHELNTPTGGALMSVSTLQSQLQRLNGALSSGLTRSALDDYLGQANEGLHLAEVNLLRAADLIRSFKRLAVDRSEAEVIEFNLADPVQDLVKILGPRLKKSRVTLNTRLPERLEMRSYPGTLSQVIQNLVENALNHAFGAQQRGQIEVSAEADGDAVLIRVSDDGRGIDPDVKDRLFDPFVTSGRGAGHTGLGLHLVHQWVHQVLRGSLQVESDAGTGTTFSIRVPRDAEA